jgi:hypothetical protein
MRGRELVIRGVAVIFCFIGAAGCDQQDLQDQDDVAAVPGEAEGERGVPAQVNYLETPASRTPATRADCAACDQASACCNSVHPGAPLCTFSAATCSSLPASHQRHYVNACLTMMRTAARAHARPPAACIW